MKKIMYAAPFLFCLISNFSLADNFNYDSPYDCKQAMNSIGSDTGYANQASTLAFNYPISSDEWEGFMDLSQFFINFSHGGSSTDISCTNNDCTLTSSIGCGMVGGKAWAFAAPILQNEVENYLVQKRVDPSLNHATNYQLVCHFPKDKGNDYSNCAVSK